MGESGKNQTLLDGGGGGEGGGGTGYRVEPDAGVLFCIFLSEHLRPHNNYFDLISLENQRS